ncbi:response regulator [Myxococcota bacterium]|nr:response regulator [Myxococcota bacterium]MBU1899231.1 response regulator [Myxococcota bacterium]
MTAETRKVVILDDDLLHLMSTSDVLEKAGYKVVSMSAPHGCIAKLDYEHPDVFLVNIAMPRLAVDDLLDTLMESDDYRDLIVVVHSGIEAELQEQCCLNKDLHGYYSKELSLDDLPAFIDRFF